MAAGAHPSRRREVAKAREGASSARRSGGGLGTGGPNQSAEPVAKRTPLGERSRGGPVSTILEETLRMERAKQTRTTGKSSWHVVVQGEGEG